MDNLRNGITFSLALHALAFSALPAIAPLGSDARQAAPLVVQLSAYKSDPSPALATRASRAASPSARGRTRLATAPAPEASANSVPAPELAASTSPAGGAREASPPSPGSAGPRASAEATPAAPVTPPLFDANYLRNPAPAYPTMSRRLREQGRVVLRVRVNATGAAEDVAVHSSSGSTRLDDAARETVLHWSFVPAHRGSEPLAAWVLVPISFRLDG
jgi:protein TonB